MKRLSRLLSAGSACVLGLGFLGLAGAGASASRPTIVSIAGSFTIPNLNDGPVGAVCAFPVSVTVDLYGGAKQITFNGQGIGYQATAHGRITNTYTNLSTGETLTVEASGPVWLSIDGSGLPVKGTGAQTVWEPIDQGGIRFIHGQVVLEPVDYGFGTVVHAIVRGGTETNLCDALA